jgi:succinate dehydrogenase / fumarate reductase flavoprotein subunit
MMMIPCSSLWVELGLIITQTTIPGCFQLGESNFSDHGAMEHRDCTNARFSRWIFCVCHTMGDYLAPDVKTGEISTDLPEFVETEKNVKSTY